MSISEDTKFILEAVNDLRKDLREDVNKIHGKIDKNTNDINDNRLAISRNTFKIGTYATIVVFFANNIFEALKTYFKG